MTRPTVRHRLRPYRSVSLPPGIISAAITSRKIVMAICTPCTVVSRSWLMSLIITFMFEPAKLQMNCASAKGISTLRSAEGDADVVVSDTAVRAPGYREPSGVIEFAVEVDGGADQREM